MRPPAGRDKILDAALDLFAEKGFHATSVDQIAKRAGVSKGLTYNYFSSKEELLVAIIDNTSSEMMKVARNHLASAGYQIALRDMLAQLGAMLTTRKKLLAFQLSLLFDPKLQDVAEAPMKKRARKLLYESERLFMRAGARDPKATARRFVAELDGIALHYLRLYDDYPLEATLVAVYENYKMIGR